MCTWSSCVKILSFIHIQLLLGCHLVSAWCYLTLMMFPGLPRFDCKCKQKVKTGEAWEQTTCRQAKPDTVEPLCSGHHWETTFSKLSLTKGLVIFLAGLVCIIRLLSTTWLCFQSYSLCCTLAEKARNRLILHFFNVIPAVTVNNLAEGRWVVTKLRLLSIVCIQLGPQKLSVVRNSGVSTVQVLVK